MGRIALTAFLVLTAAGLARPASAQELNTWHAICSENRLAGTVCAAEITTQFMRFKLTMDARGEGETAQISLRLSEGTLRYVQMRVEGGQTTYEFVCLTEDCVMGSEHSQAAMDLFATANSASVNLTTARGSRIMMRFKLGGFADALAAARAGI